MTTTTPDLTDLLRAGKDTQRAREQAATLLTQAAARKNAAYEAYLSAHRTRRELGESQAALNSPLQDTSAQDQEFAQSQVAFRQLIRSIYATHLLRPADLITHAGITRQRLHQILHSVT